MRGGGVKGRLEFFQKFIRFCSGTFPKELEYGKCLSAKDVLRTFKARSVFPSISLLEKATQKT